MKNSALTKSLLLTMPIHLALLSPAWSEISLGNKGALAIGGEATLGYDSNISANSTEDGDSIATLQPKVYYRYDQGSVLVDASVGVEFVEYNEQSQFDSENFKSEIRLKSPPVYDGETISWQLDAGFNESTRADSDLQTIVERQDTEIDFALRYYVMDRYYLASGIEYMDESIETSGFNDVTSVSVPLDLFYRYSERLSLGFGIEYRDVSIDGPASPSADSEDLAYYLALEGQLLANLESEIRIGYQERDFDSGSFDDADAFFLRAALRWFYTERTTFELAGNSGFRNTATNRSVDESSLVLSVSHEFDEKLNSKLAVKLSETEYSNLTGLPVRNDDQWGIALNTEYELIEDRLALELVLRYTDQSSDIINADYEDSLVQLGVSYIF